MEASGSIYVHFLDEYDIDEITFSETETLKGSDGEFDRPWITRHDDGAYSYVLKNVHTYQGWVAVDGIRIPKKWTDDQAKRAWDDAMNCNL